MKKVVSIILTICLLLPMASCSSTNTTSPTRTQHATSAPSYQTPPVISNDYAEQIYEIPESSDKQEIIVYVTRTGEKYHSAGCQYLSQSCIPMSLEDAVDEGYTPCSKCNPPRLD
jgi:competence protein ComEC